MEKIKVLLNGANGRMGQEVVLATKENENIEIIAGLDRVGEVKNGFPIFTSCEEINIKPDMIIDFSVPEASMKVLDYAKENNIPIIIATTGFSKEELEIIEDTAKVIPVFRSANMSYEINFMSKLVAECARKLGEVPMNHRWAYRSSS